MDYVTAFVLINQCFLGFQGFKYIVESDANIRIGEHFHWE